MRSQLVKSDLFKTHSKEIENLYTSLYTYVHLHINFEFKLKHKLDFFN
jgi:hypothetical protein